MVRIICILLIGINLNAQIGLLFDNKFIISDITENDTLYTKTDQDPIQNRTFEFRLVLNDTLIIDWGGGGSDNDTLIGLGSGSSVSAVSNYISTGIYNIKIYDNKANYTVYDSAFRVYAFGVGGGELKDTVWRMPKNVNEFRLDQNQFNSLLPEITSIGLERYYANNNSLKGIFSNTIANNWNWIRLNSNNITDYDTCIFGQVVINFYLHDNNISSDSKIDEIFEDADAGITSPVVNFIINTSGSGMGDLPNGASNVHLTSLETKYTNAGKTLTAIYNIP